VSTAQQAPHHVPAHAPEADHAELHRALLAAAEVSSQVDPETPTVDLLSSW